MFTGIIEATGTVVSVEQDQSNVHFTVESNISAQLKVDQSVCHNGVCLTVVAVEGNQHRVTAVDETLRRTNLGQWGPGHLVNLERCLPVGGRLDGHIVQGHVDELATCIAVEETGGSWKYTFQFQPEKAGLLVDKGSVCLNGVSLTVVSPGIDQFSVAIIPYTWEHTNFKTLKAGDTVNIEFDILGKYLARQMEVLASKGL
ncbi:MAG TPA: riboflavin synthase [Saprospiraceae bacterium]|nr:riboflavin synthase [Saprospiraceae bacterium]